MVRRRLAWTGHVDKRGGERWEKEMAGEWTGKGKRGRQGLRREDRVKTGLERLEEERKMRAKQSRE